MLRRFLLIGTFLLISGCESPPAARQTNVVILLADDLGYSDLALYADTGLVAPNLERMARNGMRFTDFYMAAAACSPSRAALLTGQYPPRAGITGVLMPQSERGLPSETVTLGEILRAAGYATACFGKWHLGHLEPFLPLHHGFDEYFGIPYSNDMTPDATKNPNPYARRHPPLPLVDGTETIETEPDQRFLTRRYTERALDFMARNRDKPFFLYLPYAAPHMPLYVTERFEGASGRGRYSDVLLEIDWSVGKILDALAHHGIEESTLVLFTSDNGPWLIKGAGSGTAFPLREGKGTTFEGGHRVPLLAQWPGVIPAGSVSSEMVTAMDLVPTAAAMAGTNPGSLQWDGHDIRALLRGDPGGATPYEAFFFVQGNQAQAVRSGQWKLHVPHRYRSIHGALLSTATHPGSYARDSVGLALYDLATDPGERNNVAGEYPVVTQRLRSLIDSVNAAWEFSRQDTFQNVR